MYMCIYNIYIYKYILVLQSIIIKLITQTRTDTIHRL